MNPNSIILLTNKFLSSINTRIVCEEKNNIFLNKMKRNMLSIYIK